MHCFLSAASYPQILGLIGETGTNPNYYTLTLLKVEGHYTITRQPSISEMSALGGGGKEDEVVSSHIVNLRPAGDI